MLRVFFRVALKFICCSEMAHSFHVVIIDLGGIDVLELELDFVGNVGYFKMLHGITETTLVSDTQK